MVTEREYRKSLDVFESATGFDILSAPFEEQALADAVISKKCRAVIVGVDKYSGPLYESLGKTGGENGAIIARYGVGHDGINKQLAEQHNIVVTNTPGVLDDSVAEHTVWLIGALAKQIASHDRNMKSRQWEPAIGMQVYGKTLLIVGCGNIGRKVARIAGFGFGMNVIGYDLISTDAQKMKDEFGISMMTTSLDDVISQADIVSIHLPAIESTRHFVSTHFLSRMSPDAMMINTSRGSIVDENALYEAIKNNDIAGAALDVYDQEPYVPVDPKRDLRTLPQAVLTPHVGSSTTRACEKMAMCCLLNIKDFFNNKLDNCVIVS